MRRVQRLACAALALTLAGCGGVTVQSDYDPRADFASLKTYQWTEKVPAEQKDPRVYNAIIENRVKTAVNNALGAKGYQEVTSGTPDFYLTWHGTIDQKQSLQTVGNNYGWGTGWYGAGWGGWGGGMGMTTTTTYVDQWEEGTVVVGVFDPTTDELIWWGSAQAELDEKKSPQKAQEDADKAAVKLLETFPPGASK